MDALLREAEALKGSLENSSRFLHLMPNEAPKAQNFLNQLNDKIAQLDRSDAKVQAKLPALEAAVVQAAAAIDGASKAKEVDAEIKAVEALLKKAQDAARAVIFVPGSAIRPAEADLKKLADAVAELEPALEVFIAKYGALDKAKAKVPTFQAGLAEAANKLALASTADQGAEQLKKVVELLKTTDAQQRHLKGVLFGRICNEKEASEVRRLKDELWTNATELEQHVGVSVPGDTQPKGVVVAAMQTAADADAALNKYQQDGSVETLRVEVATWSGKLQDFINRWHDENAYNVATEALERLQGLLPALEQFGDVNGFVTNTLKNAKENVEKANKNIPLAKARIESRPLVELVRKSREKLTDFISRPHVESYFNTAMEGLEELAALVPALEAYVADSSVDDLIKSTKGQIAKAEALVSAAKIKFESAPLRDKVASTHAKLNDFISRPHVQSYYNDALEAMEELKSLVPALEVYIIDSDVASAVKNAKEKMAKAQELIVKAGVQFAAEPLKNKVVDTYRKLDPFVNRWHVKEYYDTALEALEELKVLMPELEQYASDSYVATALTNARDMIRRTEAVLPDAKTRFESGPLNDKVTETHRKLDDFINRFHVEEYYNKAVEALEELQQLIPALEAYTSDTYVASNVKNAKDKVLRAEALIPQAKARFESSGVIEKIRSLLGKLSTFTHTWHHKPYFDDAVEATEEIKSLLPVLEQYSSDNYAADMIRNATKSIAEAEAVMPKARARFEGEPLRDKVVATHNRLDKFIKDWYYKEYYNEAMEAIEELNALLPALQAYDTDSYIAGVIQTAKNKIAQAEANVPQAKVKFEAEPLKDQVNTTQGRLDKFIKDWYYQEYYNDAMEALEELKALLPALEVYASDSHVSDVIKNAKNKMAQAEANIPQAKMKFESAALKDKVNATQGRLDKFIKDWYYKEYYNDAMEALEELNSLLPALEAYAADSHVADVIKYTKTKIAQAEANIPQAKVKFEAEPLKDQVNTTQGRLDKFIKDWYYQEYYNDAMEALEELKALLPALEVYASDSHVADTIKHAKNKMAQAEANIPQAKMKFESAALKDQVNTTQGRLDKFIKDWYYQEYYNDAMEALEELNSLLPALEAYAADSHVADVIKYTKTKMAQAEANIPQAKVKFEAEPLKDQVNKTQQLLDKFIKDWYYQEYYNTAVEAIDELNSLLPALEAYASDTHVAEVIKNARNKIAQAEANIPQAKVKFEAEPLKDQVNKTQGRLDKFIKDWYYQEYYNDAMEALEELSMLLPALEVYASDSHVADVIKNAKNKIAQAEANIPQAKVKFESAALKDQVTQAYSRLNDFIKSWYHKEYYNTAVETIDELNLLLPALETFASDTHVAETIKAAREKIAQAEANIPQAKVKFEAEPLRDKVGTTHTKLDNFIKSWQYKEYYDTAVETIDELEQLLPALETYASDDQVARTIKTARDKIQAAKANFPQARARFEAEPLRNKVDQLYAKLDNFIKTWQHEEYYNTAMEAMEELETLLPALEEFASDSGVATTLRAAKDRIQKAEANIPQARLKYAAEPLRAGLDKAASQLDNFIKTWHHEEYYNTAIEAVDEVNALMSALEPFASDNYVASTINSAKDKVQKAQANFPLAKARFEAKPLQEMVGKSADKLPNFIKTWQHEEYYNTAMEAIGELEALLPALEVYASDSGVATTIKVAKDRIQAAKSVVPQAKLKFEAEPLKQQVGQVAAKLDNFIKSWHHEEYFNTASEALEELKVLVPALEAYAADSHVSSVIANTKEKIAKAQANLPLAKAKYEAEPLRKQVQQHFDKLNRFASQWWVEENYNAAVESLDELSTLVPRLEAFSDGQAEATARLAREKILAAEAAMKSASLKFQAEPLKKKTEAAVTQLRAASSKWTTQENFEQGLELQQELQALVKALQPFKEDSATESVLSSAHQALLAAEERLSQLRIKYHLQPALDDARKTTSALSTFIAKWLQEEEYRKGVDAVAKAKRLLAKLAQFGANAEAQTTAEHLKQKLAEAEQQVKIAQAKHGVIEAAPESDDAASDKPAKKGAFTPYQPPKEIPFLLPEPTSFQALAESLDPPAGLNVGPMKTFVTPLEEQLARALGATVPICFNWENWVNHQSFTSKPDGTKLELIKTLYQNCARQVVGALAQLIGADQVARNLVQANTKRVVLQYDPTDSVLDGRERHNYKAERNRDGDLIVTLNMTQNAQIQLDHGLRIKFDRLYNIAVCQAQAKAPVRMKEISDKARINAYIDIEFAPFGLNQKLQAWEPKDKSKQISRFWDTLIPQGTYATTDASIKGLCQIMKEASPTAREALQRYVRRIAFTWDMEDRVSDPLEGFPSVSWYNIDVQDNNEVLITVNDTKGSTETFRQEFVVKWSAVMAIFTEKYVSESKLRTFEEKASAFVGKKVEAEINWAPTLRSHPFKILGAKRVETVLRGLHTTQLEYLTEIWKSTSEWTEAGKRILGERIDRVVITLEPTPAAWSLKLNDRTLNITMGYDQATRRHMKLQDDIEWITEATIPIEIEAANRSCAKLTKDLSEQAKKPINVGINWEAFVALPEFVGLGHDTVVSYMRNVYAVAANATAGLRTSLTHEIGFKAITAAIDSVLVVLETKNVAAEPVLSMNGSVMGVAVGYTSSTQLGKILARRERVENLLRVIVQVHKALADERYNAVVAALAKGLGRPVPIEADWSLVDTPQFEALLPEQKSYVVDCLHACFPENVVTQGLLITNNHPVGKACYSAKLKRVYFHVAPEGSVDNVLNKDGELHVELDLRSVVAEGVFAGHWQVRGEEAFDALVPIAQYDALESYNAKVAERITSTVGKALPFTPNWDFTTNPTFQQWRPVHKRQYVLAYCNGLLEAIFFGAQGLPQLCELSLVRETIAQKVDAIVAKVDLAAGRGDEDGTVAGRPTMEGTTLVLNVTLSASAHDGASWGQKLYNVLQLRPTIIAHFLERHGPPNIKKCTEELTAAATAPLSVEMDLTEVLKSKHVESLQVFSKLVDYLTVLYDLPCKIVTGKAGLAWLCTNSPDARAQLLERAKVVRLVIDTTDSTPAFEGHPYQTQMYQVRVADGALLVQFNQALVASAVQDLGEVVEWELTPAIARRKEQVRVEEERERQKQWEKERRRREKEYEKERRHRELMNKLH